MQMRQLLAAAGRAALGALALLISGCGEQDAGETPGAEASATQPIARVTTVTPARMTVRKMSEEPGQIEAIEVTPIHAKLAGYVQSVSVDIGDRVKKGQVMAVLR